MRHDTFLDELYELRYLFGDKWAPAIVVALLDGPMQRKDLLVTVRSFHVHSNWSDSYGKLQDRILTKTLKKMTAEGLLVRESKSYGFFRSVRYSLTPVAMELLDHVRPLVEWARRHPEVIARAQAYRRSSAAASGSAAELADGDGVAEHGANLGGPAES